jgi:D-serine dehydratase
MRQFVEAYGAKLAPHGKTTMSPQLFARQLAQGAWGITLATAHQTMVAYEHGVRRVLMANQLVGRENMRIVSNLIEDPAFDYYCLVDSADLVDQLGAFYAGQGRQLQVLVELGAPGGRCGVRDEQQLRSVLAALSAREDSLLLRGIEVYEGVLNDEGSIRGFLQRAVEVTRALMADNRFRRAPILLSGAGSAWYDVVADVFSSAKLGERVEIVLRPGCYLTHDVGAYSEAQTRILAQNPVAQRLHAGLVPALQIWAYVQSRPEPEKAIVTMGKRDAPFDSGLPRPALRYRTGDREPLVAPETWKVTKLMDQHAFLQIASDDDVRVGDMIAFDISHPCLTFDKWRAIAILNAGYDVADVIETWF